MTQEEVKLMLPPKSTIWQNRIKGGWMAHLPPDPRISSMFADFDRPEAALKDILQRLWRMYFFSKSYPDSACPVAGLFP